MTQRAILITGCSSGIGYDAAHALARRGWRVFATCRNPDDCARLRAEGLESFVLDHDDANTIAAAVTEATTRTGGRLDAIFANAGFGMPVAVEDLSTDALRAMFETNFFGVHELVRRVIPVMRAQGHGRIVICSSALGLAAIRWRAPYTATKFALEGYADTLRLELTEANIHTILLEPGPITSAFRANSRARFQRWVDWENSALRAGYEQTILPRLNAGQDRRDPFELPAAAVTARLIRALDAPRPRARYAITLPAHLNAFARRALPTRLTDYLRGRI